MVNRKQKRGKAAKNAVRRKLCPEPEELEPHSFVISKGRLGKNGHQLLLNFRKILDPFTASRLKVQKRNCIKDFVHMAGPLNVTHLMVFEKTKTAMYLKVATLPRGPTLIFKVMEYSLMKDVISSQKRSVIYSKLFDNHPLLLLSNFSGDDKHLRLMATMFQNMFPSINVNKVNLNNVRRCLLLNRNKDESLDLRQYSIKVAPSGISKEVERLIQSKVPDLSKYDDVASYLKKTSSEINSEGGFEETVTLPQCISSRGNICAEKSAVRLNEIGPRIKLKLHKIQEGLMSGNIL